MLESAVSCPESADSTTNFMIVGRLPLSNMFNISTPIRSADQSPVRVFISPPNVYMSNTGLVLGITEGIIKISVMPAGMKFRFSDELLHQFSCFFGGN